MKGRIADIIVVINNTYAFHLEAQMEKDDRIVLRAFEYGFYFALSTQEQSNHLYFPEPSIIYLNKKNGIPEESVLHICFGSQGNFDYHVKNFLYLAHSTEDLNRRKMAVLIPFQVLRLRSMLRHWKRCEKKKIPFDSSTFYQLQAQINGDIIRSIKLNLELGNITEDDADQLYDLTEMLREHICKDFKPQGGEEIMNPLLPGALELPNDKYRFRIDELVKENKRFADENARFADENARFADENARLKKRIAELESRSM